MAEGHNGADGSKNRWQQAADGSSRQRRQAGVVGTVRFRTCFHNVVYDVFRARAWKETDSDVDWDVCWADTGWIRENFDNIRLNEHQRINHFRNHYELTRKDSMIKNLKRAQRALQREGLEEEAAKYEFSPTTYVLPADYGLFVEEFKNHVGAFWIMKPIGGAQGKPAWSKCLALAVPQLNPRASSGCAWRLRAARHSQSEARPLGPQPPLGLKRAASKVADFTAFDHLPLQQALLTMGITYCGCITYYGYTY